MNSFPYSMLLEQVRDGRYNTLGMRRYGCRVPEKHSQYLNNITTTITAADDGGSAAAAASNTTTTTAAVVVAAATTPLH